MVPETPSNIPLNELIVLAQELQEFFESHGWRYCFIGGLAVQTWSEPRYTKDVDITLLTGFGEEEGFIDALLTRYKPRRPDARAFALVNRVLLLQNAEGIGIDIALGALDYEAHAVRRARPVEVYPGTRIRLCTPEDLIVMKAFASRERDWNDVRMTIVRQGAAKFDWAYIYEQLTPLADLKEAPEILTQLRALEKRYRDKGK
ncbi:MAG: hypothetical protein KA004_10255 [Verrucomicrobiales bacterium]|nr:hypothetical protein [Verrucomicrobiales bacterium]